MEIGHQVVLDMHENVFFFLLIENLSYGFTKGLLTVNFRSISYFEVTNKEAERNFQNCCKPINGALENQ